MIKNKPSHFFPQTIAMMQKRVEQWIIPHEQLEAANVCLMNNTELNDGQNC